MQWSVQNGIILYTVYTVISTEPLLSISMISYMLILFGEC